MKFIVIILASLNACYMLLDGIFVMIRGKFIGPEKPGPWAALFYKLNINVFKLGPLFILFGALWFVFLYAFISHQPWAFLFGIILSCCTLWYFPAGTFTAVIIIILLFIFRQKLTGMQ